MGTRPGLRRSPPSSTNAVRFPRMARRYFGTDGVRGIVGEDLTPDLVERLGKAATLWSDGGRVFVGRDTRASGPELEEAFARGVVSAGGKAVVAGGLPTPAGAPPTAHPRAGHSPSPQPPPEQSAQPL